MNLRTTFRRLATVGCGVVMMGYLAAPAYAGLMPTGVSCSGQGTVLTSDPGYVACSGSWSGNNLNQSAAVATQIQTDFGITATAPIDITGSAGNLTSGMLMIPDQTGIFVISFKAGDAFSLYEFNGALVAGGITSINFDTLGVGFFSNGGKEHFGQGISHIDIYDGNGFSVPEPGVLALFAAGLAGLGFALSRRRSKV